MIHTMRTDGKLVEKGANPSAYTNAPDLNSREGKASGSPRGRKPRGLFLMWGRVDCGEISTRTTGSYSIRGTIPGPGEATPRLTLESTPNPSNPHPIPQTNMVE